MQKGPFMTPPIFISHSARDRATADAVCAVLEARGLRCWIAPRDVPPGADWSAAITDAIAAARVMVLLFSSHSNQSEQVKREVSLAVSQAKVILPLRIENVQPSGSMLYFLGTVHWLDALQAPFEPHWQRLADRVAGLINAEIPAAASTGTVPPAPAPSPAAATTPGALANKNSLGNFLIHAGKEFLPAGHPPTALFVSSTCVSNGDYLEFVRAGGPEPRGNPKHPEQRTWRGKHCPDDMLDHPVVYVSHADALLFCDWLTDRERRQGGIDGRSQYTLPTGEQWRAFVGDARLPRDAITDRQWQPGAPQPTIPVSWGDPSPLGLLHVFGNVFEWCLDTMTKDGVSYCLALGGGWASTRDWLARQVRDKTYGDIWRRQGLPMKDGGFRICLVTEEPQPR
jgi:hypothetical protein